MSLIDSIGNYLVETHLHVLPFSVADGFNQQVAKRTSLKLEFSENVKDLSAK